MPLAQPFDLEAREDPIALVDSMATLAPAPAAPAAPSAPAPKQKRKFACSLLPMPVRLARPPSFEDLPPRAHTTKGKVVVLGNRNRTTTRTSFVEINRMLSSDQPTWAPAPRTGPIAGF